MFKYVLILLVVHVLYSCQGDNSIHGEVNGIKQTNYGSKVYLVQPISLFDMSSTYAGNVIDSAVINDKGRFSFKNLNKFSDEVLLELTLQSEDERFKNKKENDDLNRSNYIPIIYKSCASVRVSSSADDFQKSAQIMSDLPAQKELNKLIKLRHEGWASYQNELKSLNGDEYIIERNHALKEFQSSLIEYADNTDYMLPAMVALRWVSPIDDYERVAYVFDRQCMKWGDEYKEHTWIYEVCERANSEDLPLQVGDSVPKTSLPLLNGETTTLSDVLGSKLTILDFWASWCAPCRKENKEILRPLYENYKAKGLEIIGYALESERDIWLKAIQNDKAESWIHVSHLQGDDAPLMNVFKIETIPANYIIDGNGKIIAKNVNGEALAKLVSDKLD